MASRDLEHDMAGGDLQGQVGDDAPTSTPEVSDGDDAPTPTPEASDGDDASTSTPEVSERPAGGDFSGDISMASRDLARDMADGDQGEVAMCVPTKAESPCAFRNAPLPRCAVEMSV